MQAQRKKLNKLKHFGGVQYSNTAISRFWRCPIQQFPDKQAALSGEEYSLKPEIWGQTLIGFILSGQSRGGKLHPASQ